ncbi:AarF/ABC1/UbiB kinase family protein [Gordonia sp. NPDC003585]|uniref:ABC1 kinase family protein n=1 Tax=Gordonia sp. NPDC003585 TaxID=3154275 RepID=UPI0033B8A5A7
MTDEAPQAPDRFGEVRAGRVRRTIPVVGFAARSAGGRVVAGLRQRAGNEGAVDDFHRRTADRYADLLGHSKGVLMKAGQLMSTFDGSGPTDGPLAIYQQALRRLQADAPPMDADTAREIVEAELGKPIEKLFAGFSPEPMAAASIGQVHVAWLPDGRRVAVKVQYPGVAQAIRHDLANTELLATFFKLSMSLTPRAFRTDQRAAAAELSERIAEELDYRHEARSISRFADLYRGHPFIRIPEVVANRSTNRVLTMSYVDGVGWSEALTADQDLRNHWGEVIGYFAFGAYRHGSLFNADPHPGNYRFGDDGSVGFVDFGCVKQFPEWVRTGIVHTYRATLAGDRDEVFRLANRHGFLDTDADLTADQVFEWWAMMSRASLGEQPHSFVADDSGDALRSFIGDGPASVAFRRMSVPSDYVMLARISLGVNAVLSGLGATFDTREQSDALDGIGEPTSDLAKAHTAWVRERGLPFGLDPR